MNKIDKKRVEKVYLKIDSISKKGEEGFIEYKAYIDELVDEQKFYVLENVLERKYKIDTADLTVVDIKSPKIYGLIRFKTHSPFQESLKKLYDSYGLYVIGINVFRNGELIGEIMKVSDPQNPDLETVRAVNSEILELTINDPEITTINKYKMAVEYLLQTV